MDLAKEKFKDQAEKEREAVKTGINRKEFIGNTVNKKFLSTGMLDLLKNMAGSWGKMVKGASAARVTNDGKHTKEMHATHDKVGKKNVVTMVRPIGARRFI